MWSWLYPGDHNIQVSVWFYGSLIFMAVCAIVIEIVGYHINKKNRP